MICLLYLVQTFLIIIHIIQTHAKMRIVIQRVTRASVSISKEIVGKIGKGILIFVGIETDDTIDDIKWLCGKISRLRIFDDKDGTMNLSLMDINAEILVVSQFTLHASTKKGNRPSYIRAAHPNISVPLYEQFIKTLSAEIHKEIPTGRFGAMMKVSLVNDGPVTIIIDSKIKE